MEVEIWSSPSHLDILAIVEFQIMSLLEHLIHLLLIFVQRFLVKKLEKNKKTHRFNVVQRIAYIHKNREEDFHYM